MVSRRMLYHILFLLFFPHADILQVLLTISCKRGMLRGRRARGADRTWRRNREGGGCVDLLGFGVCWVWGGVTSKVGRHLLVGRRRGGVGRETFSEKRLECMKHHHSQTSDETSCLLLLIY